ncbi:unnamed protein product, partial [Ectocarpus sp. 13 AM-2016]
MCIAFRGWKRKSCSVLYTCRKRRMPVSQRMPWMQVSEPSTTKLDFGSLIEKRANVCVTCGVHFTYDTWYNMSCEAAGHTSIRTTGRDSLVLKNRRGECIRSYNHLTSKIKYLHAVFWMLSFSHRVGADKGTITQGMALSSRMIRIPFASLVYISDLRTKEPRICNTSAIAVAGLQTYFFTL